jgi:predicted enzyme related to lactoylglutathione lyase
MINGLHAILFSEDADRLRKFLGEVLGFESVDAGGGWLIFGPLPPAELAVHPSEGSGRQELYLMCDDVERTVEELEAKGIELAGPISDEGWGRLTAIKLPGGGELGLYEPRHPSPIV